MEGNYACVLKVSLCTTRRLYCSLASTVATLYSTGLSYGKNRSLVDNYGTRTSKVFSAFRVTVKQASLDAMHASTVRSYALFNRLVNS